MSIKKEEAIQTIMTDFEKLSNLVLNQLDTIENVITNGTLPIHNTTHETIEQLEQQIDELEVKISTNIINTIVLYQPLASNLRKIMACYRMVISLERISDYVVNITAFIQKLKSPEVFEQLHELLQNMIIQGTQMVREALLSFLNDDRELAIWTLKNEPAFKEINSKIFKKVLKKMASKESNRKFVLSIISIKEMMSNIERIADHGTNIASASIYYLDGKNIRHQKLPK